MIAVRSASLHAATFWQLIEDSRENAGGDPDEQAEQLTDLLSDLPPDEIAKRIEAYEAPASRYKAGVLAKYARHVGSASEGAVTS